MTATITRKRGLTLTPRQTETFEKVKSVITRTGSAPTAAEIAKQLGLQSVGGARPHLKALEKKGLIRRTPEGIVLQGKAKSATKSVRSDSTLSAIDVALTEFKSQHPSAKIDMYRQSGFNVRLRIIDKSFAGHRTKTRHQSLWKSLASLSLKDKNQLSFMVLITPSEVAESIQNYEFDHPSWSEDDPAE